MTNESCVLRRDDGPVTTLTLNRPEKLNALNTDVFNDLRRHLDDLGTDPSVRCVVLTGAGRSFCAGHDLGGIAAGEHSATPHFEAQTIDVLENLPVPTIAKIRGHCLTGGLELALGCDLLVAATSALLGDTHGQWGLAPIWGMSVRLPERIGLSKAKELMFTSRRIDASRAAEIGLIDYVADDDRLDEAVEKLAGEIVANSAGTNRIVKALLHATSTLSRREALDHERRLPFGLPDDMRERLRTGARAPSAPRE